MPPLDPVATGLRLIVSDRDGVPHLDVAVPAGAYDAVTRTGWETTATGFAFASPTPVGGVLRRVALRPSSTNAAELKIAISGSGGTFAAPVPALPLTTTVVFDPSRLPTERCGQREFTDVACRLNATGTTATCEQRLESTRSSAGGPSGTRRTPRSVRAHADSRRRSIRPAVVLPCLVNLETIAEIDALSALVSPLKGGQAGGGAVVRDIRRDLKALLEVLAERTPALSLPGGAAAFTASVTGARKAVRRAVNAGPPGFKKRKTKALDALEALGSAIDGECSDGVFCNGLESCDVAAADCTAGTDPCTPPQVCDEATDGCQDPPAQTFILTLDQDIFVAGDTNDLFVANLAFNAPTATSLPTLQTGDDLRGGGGNDVLTATLNLTAPGTIVPALAGIETVNLNDLGTAATTLAGSNVTDVDVFNFANGINANPFVLSDLGELVSLGLSEQEVGATLTFLAPATAGGADRLTLTLSNVRDPGLLSNAAIVTVATAANGLEALDVVSNGMLNSLAAITQTGGTSLTTVTGAGAAPLAIRRQSPLPGTLTTVDMTATTGGTDLSIAGNQNVSYGGGAGNDTINFAGTYTTADTVDGGGGADTLGLNAAQAGVAVPQPNVTSIANIMIVNTLLGESVDVTHFGATDAILDSTAGNVLLLNLPSTLTLASGDRTLTLINDEVNDQLSVVVPGAGTADRLTINARNSDHTFGGTAVLATGAETVDLVSGNGPDGTPADGGSNSFLALDVAPTTGTGTLNVLGDVPFVVTVRLAAGTINAAGSGAALIMETATSTASVAGASIIGSAFADELTGGPGNESITGGEGADQMKGLIGADILTGGNGADRAFLDAVNQFGDTFVDFVAGSDQVGLGSGIINFAGVSGTEQAPVALLAGNFETGRAAVTELVAGDALNVVRLSAAQTTAQLTSDVGAAVAAYVLAFDSTLQRGVLFHDADWSSAGGRTLVVQFDSITSLAGLQALTAASFVEMD